MNIAIISNDYNPPWDEGTKKIVRILVNYLESKGDLVTIITKETITDLRVLPKGIRRVRILKQIETIFLYKKIIKNKRIDLLFKVIQAGPFFSVKPFFFEKILGKPFYLYVSSILEGKRFYNFLVNQKRVLVGGNYLKFYFPKAHVVYPIIDPNKIGEVLPQRRGGLPHKKVILFLGAFQKERGVEILIKAVGRLKNKQNIRLILAWNGRGELLDIIKNTIKEEGLEKIVSILGSTDIAELYSKAHIVVIPRLVGPNFEKKMFFPLRIIESMSFGKPLIVSNVYDLATVINGCGIVAKPGSIEELESAIYKLCTDLKFYDSCSQECLRQFKEKYHPQLNLERIYEILHI